MDFGSQPQILFTLMFFLLQIDGHMDQRFTTRPDTHRVRDGPQHSGSLRLRSWGDDFERLYEEGSSCNIRDAVCRKWKESAGCCGEGCSLLILACIDREQGSA
ncbi:hypothetical protein SAY86_014068 [Trapa natans]|uniref:Secreted protein n=1 Tax=Trapa natans TaxID=22666 RepID=A0AAN7QQG5_TRANT|nr:hypothetical protein SAY86_014068 [Trapa natans]